jgi:hypothetical protein
MWKMKTGTVWQEWTDNRVIKEMLAGDKGGSKQTAASH